MLHGQGDGDVVLDLRKLLLIVQRGKALARRTEKLLGFAILIAAEVDAAEVLFDLARRKRVTNFDEQGTRRLATRDRVRVPTENSQRVEQADLHGGRAVRIVQRL